MPSPVPPPHRCEQAAFAARLYADLLERHPGLARDAAADPALAASLRTRAGDLARQHLLAYGCCGDRTPANAAVPPVRPAPSGAAVAA